MGRRSTNPSPGTGAALPYDTVGMTILPGRSLPEWAEPAAAAADAAAQSGPELIADATDAASDQVSSPGAEQTHAPLEVPEQWAAVAATAHVDPARAVEAPEPAFAMAGAALVGAAAGPPPMSQASAGALAQAQGYGRPSPASSVYGSATDTVPTASAERSASGGLATATYGTGAEAATISEPGRTESGWPNSQLETPAPDVPSSGWKSPERPELSAEHVALLSWWADMIAAGQFPAPSGTPGTEAVAPAKPPRRSFPVKAAVLGLIAVAAVGTAVVVGPKVMALSDPAVVPATEVSLPATVGGLVAITDPAVGSELETLLGFGLRPAGVTVTGAYGTAVGGPLAMAAMATTMGAPAEAVGQIATWAERTGATVAPSVAGTGATEGITCAAVAAIPDSQPGAFCVWTASGKRGQTYSVAMTAESAEALTNEVRASVTGA